MVRYLLLAASMPFHGLPDPLVPFDPVSRYVPGKQLAKPGMVYIWYS